MKFLAQKAKGGWLKEGDDNTTLFHQSIRQIQIQIFIFFMKDMHGNWTTEPSQVPKAFLGYYRWLIGSKIHSRTKVMQVVLNQGPLLDDAMKALLNATYTKEEVEAAIWDIDGRKTPGPDGFVSSFFKGTWM